ncbi:MAG: HlyD family type I secretion periplasmic adaptor subunit [Pseudomonadota bacterium]
MRAMDRLEAGFPAPRWRFLGWFAIAALLAGGAWAATTQLDEVAVAPGVLAPHGRVRVVQHLEGGITEAIHVNEGDRVRAGEPLAQLDLGAGGLNLDQIQVDLDALLLERGRLVAESAQIDLHFPEDAAARQPAMAAAERAAYRSAKREHESSLAVLRDQRSQRELEIERILAQLASARERLRPLRQQQQIAETLMESQLMPRTQALSFDHDAKEIEGEIAALEIALPLAQTALAEARERELFERNRFRNRASDRLREVEMALAEQTALQERASAQQRRTTVASPIDGVVKTLAVNTIGGVVGAGEPIAEIVPVDERLVVEARVAPQDVGQVHEGQRVQVKVSAYDFLIYGALDGVVETVSADATQASDGAYFFKVTVGLEVDHLRHRGERRPLTAGMNADVDFVLGQRSLLWYLVEPLMRLRSDAFREA